MFNVRLDKDLGGDHYHLYREYNDEWFYVCTLFEGEVTDMVNALPMRKIWRNLDTLYVELEMTFMNGVTK